MYQPAPPIGHYTDALSVNMDGGRLIFVSGKVPIDRQGHTVGQTMAEQAEQVFQNLIGSLSLQGASLSHLLKVST